MEQRRLDQLSPLHRKVVKLKMKNNSNTCYINSTVFSILWQACQRVDVRIPESWRRALEGGNWNPVGFLNFQLVGWRRPHSQHDVAEFIQLLMPKLNWIGDGLSWGARVQVGGQVEEFLLSERVHVLLMVTPDGICSSEIQQLINQWRNQAHTYAMLVAPQHLYIQLPRYRETPQGIVKHTIPINLTHREIQLPVFTSQHDVEVSWKNYEITTAIIHLGHDQHSGHYRVAAFDSNPHMCWYSNDNQAAELHEAIPAEVSEHSYILGCRAR